MTDQPLDHPTLNDVVAVLDEQYPPRLAESWDAIGLVTGDPTATIRRIHFAIDPVAAVVAEAISGQADLLVSHHPLLLHGVHGFAETTAKGRVVSRLLRHGVALFTAHTNADAADPGVSDALADVLGLSGLRPLDPAPAEPLDKLVAFVPTDRTAALLDALAAVGAGAIGDYTRCAFTIDGRGTFRPERGAAPYVGRVGQVTEVAETRLEMVVPRARRTAVVDALRAAHPYEEPAYDVVELALPPGAAGVGRVGDCAEVTTVAGLTDRAARSLPATAWGVRASGDPRRPVHRVAVCGGAGAGYLDAAARAGVDAYLTADLRHHPASEYAEEGGPALLDVAHWASEWPWLPVAAARLRTELARRGATVEVSVSTRVTDPWTLHSPSPVAVSEEPDRGP